MSSGPLFISHALIIPVMKTTKLMITLGRLAKKTRQRNRNYKAKCRPTGLFDPCHAKNSRTV